MKLFKQAQKYGARVRNAAAVATVALLASPAFAQTETPFDSLMDAIALGDMTAKIVAIGILIVGIAVAFKAVGVAKRAVAKV